MRKFFYGPSGRGKTYLLKILIEILKKDGYPVIYLSTNA